MTLNDFEEYYKRVKNTEDIVECAKFLKEYGDNFFGMLDVEFDYFNSDENFEVFEKIHSFSELEDEFLEYLKSKDLMASKVYLKDDMFLIDQSIKSDFEEYLEIQYIESMIANIQENIHEIALKEFMSNDKDEDKTFGEFLEEFFILKTSCIKNDTISIDIYEKKYSVSIEYAYETEMEHKNNINDFCSQERAVVWSILNEKN